jgi:ribonuclease D
VQLSSLDHCFLFRLNLIDFPSSLADFLADKHIQKIGLSLRDDLTGLNKLHSFKPDGFIDIQSIAQSYGIMELGLQKIYAILFGQKISKSQRLTNWENPELSEQQQRYAATDAWASLKIYLQLMNEKMISKKEIKKMLDENAQELREKQALNNPPTAQGINI